MLIYVNYSLNWQEKQRDQYAQQLFGMHSLYASNYDIFKFPI